jgi:hypothetical protein
MAQAMKIDVKKYLPKKKVRSHLVSTRLTDELYNDLQPLLKKNDMTMSTAIEICLSALRDNLGRKRK